MADETNGNAASGPHGIFIRGTYLGVQPARTFTRTGTGETVNVKPKIGVAIDGSEVAIKAKDDEQMAATIKGKIKGDLVTILVEARPPFGAKGDVDFVLPGVIADRGETWR